jgi:hypothetical protein
VPTPCVIELTGVPLGGGSNLTDELVYQPSLLGRRDFDKVEYEGFVNLTHVEFKVVESQVSKASVSVLMDDITYRAYETTAC